LKHRKKNSTEGRKGRKKSVLLPPPRALCTEVSSPRSLNPRDLTSGAGADTFSVEAPSAAGCRGGSEAPSAGAAGVGGGEATFSSA